jgi:hypothetical protein
VKDTLQYTDTVVQVTTTLARVSDAIFLYYDHLVWLMRYNVISIKNADNVSKRSNQWWLCTISMGLIRDVHEIR